jgi:hypothetical protein
MVQEGSRKWERKGIGVSLTTPDKIRDLQTKLYEAAKRDPKRRFHTLYDKVWRPDILAHAYALCRSNGGAPGVDGVTFEQIEAQGRERFLEELGKELKEHRYEPDTALRKPSAKSTRREVSASNSTRRATCTVRWACWTSRSPSPRSAAHAVS